MTISQVSQKYEISRDTLRYYEKIGLLPRIARTEGGLRSYSPEDCSWVEYIKCMRAAGVSVEILREYVELFRKGPETTAQRKALLCEQRRQIAERVSELQAALLRLDKKLDGYEDMMLKYESEHLGAISPDRKKGDM